MSFSFRVLGQFGEARLTELTTPHGTIYGPFFQFVATQAAIRGIVTSEDLEKMAVQVVLANTFHLHLRPGEDVIKRAGGLHHFMQWDRPLTTDSGGYQVFSLGKHVTIDEAGVKFRAPLDGSLHVFTPESVVTMQAQLGADLVMPLDVCTRFGASRDEAHRAVVLTTKWAKRCKEEFKRIRSADTTTLTQTQVLYGIAQGGVYPDVREEAVEALRDIGFFGYCVGGELREGDEKLLREVVPQTVRLLPEDAPRYLMGYGQPEDIIEAVRFGVDQFDCVLPVRNGRHGQLYSNLNMEELKACLIDPIRPIHSEKLYTKIDICKSAFRDDFSAFSPDHPVITKSYSKAYIHHLMRAEVPSGIRFCVLHNIHFYEQLMETIRSVITNKMQNIKSGS